MKDTTFYSNICQAMWKSRFGYLCWGGGLDLLEEMSLIVKRAMNEYMYRVLFIVPTYIQKEDIVEKLASSNLMEYQLNRITYVPAVSIQDVKDNVYDVIIPYCLEGRLTVDEIDEIIALSKVSRYVNTKLFFIGNECDSFINAAIHKEDKMAFTSMMKLYNNKKKAKFILHEMILKKDGEANYNFCIDRANSSKSTTYNETYADYIDKINIYNRRFDYFVYVKCTQDQYYSLLEKEI